ncbi:nb-arc domain containing protein, partial [Fusarium agapanthi]
MRLIAAVKSACFFLLGQITITEVAKTPRGFLQTWPIPDGVPVATSFDVKARVPGGKWAKIETYQPVLNEVNNFTTGGSIKHNSSLAYFDFNGTVEIQARYLKDRVSKAVLRPYYLNLTPKKSGSVITFTLDQPRDIIVQVNDDIFDALHIFTNPLTQTHHLSKIRMSYFMGLAITSLTLHSRSDLAKLYDCIAAYAHRDAWYGNSTSITIQNSILWADVAHPINIGTHGNTEDPETIAGLTIRNIDILDQREGQVDYQGTIALNPGDGNLIQDVLIDDVRVEDIRAGQLLNFRVMYNTKYNTSPGRGIKDVLVRDLKYTGTKASMSILVMYDEDRTISNVTFENLVINGKVISDKMQNPGWCLTTDFIPAYANEHVLINLVRFSVGFGPKTARLGLSTTSLIGCYAQASSLSRQVQYQIIPRNQRTKKALFVDKVDLTPVDRVFARFEKDVTGFWAGSDDRVHLELRRRLACVVIFLRSKLGAQILAPPQVAEVFPGVRSFTDLRSPGRKYDQIAQRLGGVEAIFWLPLDVPASTYERYLSVDDEEVVTHLSFLKPSFQNYNELVQRLVLSQLSYQLFHIMYALGGTDIPAVLLKSIRLPQRRWNADGEVDQTSAAQFGLPTALLDLLYNEAKLSEAMSGPSPSLKQQVWPILERTLKTCNISASLRTHVIEAVLYFCESDSLAIRRAAAKQAKLQLRKSMPYYLHASVVLFSSILHRIDGELAKSEAQIREFLWRGPRPSTRRDHAIEGWLHISQMENKIKCYDSDVPQFAYKWKAKQPLSTLDMEVAFRLQSTAARYFQSIGDSDAARASLEQFLSLGRIKPIPTDSRCVLLGRLSDVYCEIGEYVKALEIPEPELEHINPGDRVRRGFRRLILAVVEANIGLKQFDAAQSALEESLGDLPPYPEDINDQQMHMRTLLASARMAHMRLDPGEAIRRWVFALEQVSQMHAIGSSHGFIAA